MPLKKNIEEDLGEAAKRRDEVMISTLRLFKAGLKNSEIAQKRELTDAEIQILIAGQIKRHKESIEAFKKAGRDDLAEREEKQLQVMVKYLPPQLSDEEIKKIIGRAIEEKGVTSVKQFGLVMAEVMKEAAGQVEGDRVKALVEEALRFDN